MPDYRQQVSSPSLQGLSVSSGPMVDSSAYGDAAAGAVTKILAVAAGAYGRKQARDRGEDLGGEETYERAGVAADAAQLELETMLSAKEKEIGKPVTADQARDLKEEVFNKTLTNYKRIEGALKRGLISSTEATARLSVLRNEALSNPLIAPYQDELDNALFKATGGGTTKFGPTADEQRSAAERKGQLEGIEATEKQAGEYIQSGLAASRKQALSIIAQQKQYEANMQFYNEKKARLGVTSQEAYAASQTLSTSQSASAYAKINQWISTGAGAKEVAGIRMALVQEGEQYKQAIRASAVGADGQLLVDQDTLRQQLSEVDARVRDFSAMLEDQSATKDLMRIMAERTAALDYQNQDIQIELTKLAPLFMAMKDNHAAGQWLWENAINVDKMKTQWQSSSNPLLRMISRLSPQDAQSVVNTVNEKTVKGAALNEDEQAIAAQTLVTKGATGAVKEAYTANPEQTVKQLSEIPFRLKDISSNLEWVNAGKTEEGLIQLKAIVDGAARRAVVSNFVEAGKSEGTFLGLKTGSTRDGNGMVPANIKVSRKESLRGQVGGYSKSEVWDIDTGGVWVSEAYQSEVVNAYKLGTKVPTLWNQDYASVDEWINDLFTRNEKPAESTNEEK